MWGRGHEAQGIHCRMARPQEHSGQTPVPDPEGVSFAEVSTWLVGGSALEEVMRSGTRGWWNLGKGAATPRGENLREWVLPVRVTGKQARGGERRFGISWEGH